MKSTNTKHTFAGPRRQSLLALPLALAGGLFAAPLTSYAQPILQDVMLKAADDAPIQAPHSPLPTPVSSALRATPSMPERAEVSSSVRTAEAIQSSGDRQEEGHGSVRFSEWLKDNPEAARNRNRGSVQESEIRAILADALQRAIERSPMLRQSRAELAAADADVREAEGQRWPQIDVGANTPATSIGGGNGGSSSSEAISLNMTTNVFDWGRTSNTIDSRKELSNAAGQKYLASLETLAQNVSGNIVELEKARRISAISEQYVKRMSSLVGMLTEIVALDRGRASELTQARARLMEAEAGRDAALARVRDIEIELRKLIGDVPVTLPENGDWSLSTANLEQLLAAAQNHPSLRQAEAEANASERHAESLRAGEKPQLNWVVSKSTGQDELGREQAWQTMMTVSWPIFRGGSSRAARESASLRAEAERERKAQQQMDLEFETRAAEQDAKTLLARADLYRNLTSETDDVRKAFFEQWYHLGRRTLLDVLIAESDHNNNLVNEVSNRFDGYRAVLRAYGSSGQLTQWLRDGLNPFE